MAAEIAEAKKKTAYAEFCTALVKYVLGPVIVALGIGGYAAANHQQSAVGYEVLAKALNHEVMDKLEALEKRVAKLETPAPTSQPVVAPTTQPGVKIVKPPVAAKAPAKAPPTPVKVLPAAKAPVRVPVKMDMRPTPPEPKPSPKMMKRVPDRLGDAKL